MQRSILKIKLWHKVKLSEIKKETKALNLKVAARSLKIHYAGHVARENGKWTKLTEEWTPLDHKRKKGRPPTRWRDELVREFGLLWKIAAQDRARWKRMVEAYARRCANKTGE